MVGFRPLFATSSMNLRANFLAIACVFACASHTAARDKAIVEMELDEHIVYTVPVSAGRITTISFPGPISAIDAALVTIDSKHAGLFQISHNAGAYFLLVQEPRQRRRTNINVRWNNKTYVLELQDSANPVLSLIFNYRRERPLRPGQLVSPAILLGLLDKAKAFPLLKEHHPEAVELAEYADFREKPKVMDFDEYETRLEEVFRFEPQDTLVFRVVFRNKTDRTLDYNPQSFAVRVGERVYSQSISDASGMMPPKSDSPAYFAITGTPSGGRNDLSIKNDFQIISRKSGH